MITSHRFLRITEARIAARLAAVAAVLATALAVAPAAFAIEAPAPAGRTPPGDLS
jgi:hypothetical protein